MTAWRWFLLVLLLVMLALLGSLALMLQSLVSWATDGVHVSVNGDVLPRGALSIGSALLAGGGVLLALLIVACVVPFAVLLAVVLALCAAGFGVGMALLSVLGVAALVLSPLLLLLALLWWALRPRKPRPPAAAA